MSARVPEVRRPQPAVLAWLALMLLVACTEETSGGDQGPPVQSAAPSPSCTPLSVTGCPCLGGGTGTQTCLATGGGFGPCQGCPPPPAAPAAGTGVPPAAGGAAPPASGGVDAAVAVEVPDAGADPTVLPMGDAGTAAPDAGIAELGIAPFGTAIGVSCGVGLPVLCALEGEKCCARSLRTDTCIGATETCDCDLGDCTVMEAFCDGPEDCPEGQVCCGTLVGGSRYDRFACSTSCDYAGTQRIACHQDAADCPGNNECANSQLLTNVQVCIDPATIRQ